MDKKTIKQMARISSIFSNELRIKILLCISREREVCVGKIVEELEMRQSTISNQLRILKMGGLVEIRKEGTTVFYRLTDEHVFKILQILYKHAEEDFYGRTRSS